MRNVAEWLDRLGLGRYAEVFSQNDIDGDVLPQLTDADLRELGLSLGHRRKLLTAIEQSKLEHAYVNAAASQHGPGIAADEGLPPRETLAERRQVTVLFADLSGFTQLTRELDAEQTHALLNTFFEAVDPVIEDYGGTIDKHVGDAAMGVFGAPIAHTNDPERAVRAAIGIHEAVRRIEPPFSAHIGIASGQVIASGTGSAAYQEYTVTGESVNLASRLTDLAKADETLISEGVRLALEDRLDLEGLGQTQLDGLTSPVAIWRLKGLKLQASATSRCFVGRVAEIRQFEGIVASCLETRLGQTIYVRGEPGIGKTRLVGEFRRIAETNNFETHAGLALDFGAGRGQDPIRTIVRSLLRVRPGGTQSDRASAAKAVHEQGQLEPNREVFLNDLLDLPQTAKHQALYDAMENATRNLGKQKVVCDLVQRASARQPLLLIAEDIHWASKVTLAHLASLARTAVDCRAILLMTSRAEGDPIDQAWRGATGSVPLFTLDLGPLRDAEAFEFAESFSEVASGLARTCVSRAKGNPLFLEQLLRGADESGEDVVPGSIQSIVLARLDRLEPRDKAAIQAASVIGQKFTVNDLRQLIDDPHYDCTNLATSSLIQPDGTDFLFANALVRDSVYGSLLNSQRAELHRRAAEWFDERDPILHADHLLQAGDKGAARACLKAARQHAAEYRYESALDAAQRGFAVATDKPTQFAIGCLQGDMLRELGHSQSSIETFERVLGVSDEPADRCRAWLGIGAGMRVVDRYHDADAILRTAEDLALEHGLSLELAKIHHLRGNIQFPLGNFDACLEQHEAALRYARQSGSRELEAAALGGLGDAYFVGGQMLTAFDSFEQCIAISRQEGLTRIEIANLHMLGETRAYKNEMRQALDDCSVAAEQAADIGHYRAELATRCVMAYLLHDMGRDTDAEVQSDLSLTIARRLGSRRFEALANIYKAQVLATTGHIPEAIDLLGEAIAIGRFTGITYSGPWALGALALIAEDTETRSQALHDGEQLLLQDCVSHNYLWFYRFAIEASLQSSNWDEAERFAKALDAYTSRERLPWSDFFIDRARALSAIGRGQREESTIREIMRLRDKATEIGFATALPALNAALDIH